MLRLIVAGWINHRQRYAVSSTCVPKPGPQRKLGKKRILLDDNQRRRLVVKGKIVGRRVVPESRS